MSAPVLPSWARCGCPACPSTHRSSAPLVLLECGHCLCENCSTSFTPACPFCFPAGDQAPADPFSTQADHVEEVFFQPKGLPCADCAKLAKAGTTPDAALFSVAAPGPDGKKYLCAMHAGFFPERVSIKPFTGETRVCRASEPFCVLTFIARAAVFRRSLPHISMLCM